MPKRMIVTNTLNKIKVWVKAISVNKSDGDKIHTTLTAQSDKIRLPSANNGANTMTKF